MNTVLESPGKIKMLTSHHILSGDLETPITSFLKLCPDGPAFLLESASGGEQVARYSFIGYNPFLTLVSQDNQVELRRPGQTPEVSLEHPFNVLRRLMDEYRVNFHPSLPRFYGGAVGYFSYDTAAMFEPIGQSPPDELMLPEIYMQFMQNVVVFDHFKHQLFLVVNRPLYDNESSASAKQIVLDEIQEMVTKISAPLSLQNEDIIGIKDGITPLGNMSEKEFMEKICKAKEYIKSGDIFQVVLSQRFKTAVNEDPFTIYRKLRSLNPSPYMFFLRNEDVVFAGASPEMLVRLEGETVTTRPIAGTRPRGMTEEEDQALEEELKADEKEQAEHVMLVDLGRNDIGRVASYGSVRVKEYAKVERYSHVMHLVSEVDGKLNGKKDALDVLEACFPAGTLTGAPKVRAMQIINELEKVKRGPYGGAVGYLDFNGNMDTCIAIRTIIIKDKQAYIQTGAGIVADSDPHSEYMETMHKARAMFRALGVDHK